jgi:hypothetical protein
MAASHIDQILADFAVGSRPVDSDVATKWDNAFREHRNGRGYY